MSARFAVAQLGARMHYAVPRAFAAAGILSQLYTDIYAKRAARRILSLSAGRFASLSRVLQRHDSAIDERLVTSFPSMGLRYALRLRKAHTPDERSEAYLWAGQSFCREIVRSGLNGADAIYCYNDAALELFEHARARGVRCVLEQTIAPLETEIELLAEESRRFPEWGAGIPSPAIAARRIERQRREWELADEIVCGSVFVKDSIRDVGGPSEKAKVIPYGVGAVPTFRPRPAHDGPLRVLTVGAAGLRKGTPYIFAAAEALGKEAEFRVIGSIDAVCPHELRPPANVQLTGPIVRSAVQQEYERADLFLLPSICEGSATVIYEALAASLPVVCTPNAGSVVTDGLEGFLVPIRDAARIADRLRALADSSLRSTMAEAACKTARNYSSAAYGERLIAELA